MKIKKETILPRTSSKTGRRSAWVKFAIIAILAIVGFGLSACDDGNDAAKDPCASGHAFSDWTEPTCTMAGNSTRTCTRSGCKVTDSRTEGYAALGHADLADAKAATCTETGATGSGTCTRCLLVITEKTIDALGHAGLAAAKAATCTEAGVTGSGTCTRCLLVITDTVIDALGHADLTEPKEATCLTEGNSEKHGKCARCLTNIIGTVLPALGHTWNDNEIFEPTCANKGYTRQTCIYCEPFSAARKLTIGMWDRAGDGWDQTGALIIKVNGIDLPQNARLASGSTGTYDFTAYTDDEVSFYWNVGVGSRNENENAFAVYYSDEPPDPPFYPASASWSTSDDTEGKVLFFRQYNTLRAEVGNNTKFLGTIRILKEGERIFNVVSENGHICDWSSYNSSDGQVSCERDDCSGGFAVIGDKGPAGGIIFYVAPEGFKVQGYTGETGAFDEYTAFYLEAAPSNETRAYFGGYNKLIIGITTLPNGPDESIIGNGRKDTQIIANYLTTAEETGRAAQVCVNKTLSFEGKTFNDWFLPSIGELMEMYKATGKNGMPTEGQFMSSSQRDSTEVWGVTYPYGLLNFHFKNNNYDFRAVRAF